MRQPGGYSGKRMSSTVASYEVAMLASHELGKLLYYSPFAFASKELETAFQRDLPMRVGRIMARNIILLWAFTAALTTRILRNPSPNAHTTLVQTLLAPCTNLVYTAVTLTAFTAPNFYRKYWMSINTAMRLSMILSVLATWEAMPPEPVRGPLTFGGAVLSYFVGVLTPSILVIAGATPLPLLLHIFAQAVFLGGLFMADAKLCSMRLASPDLPRPDGQFGQAHHWHISDAHACLREFSRPQVRPCGVLWTGSGICGGNSAHGLSRGFVAESIPGGERHCPAGAAGTAAPAHLQLSVRPPEGACPVPLRPFWLRDWGSRLVGGVRFPRLVGRSLIMAS
eukprot:jgi/Botrbrau1/19993/Bobra.200_1s0003.1